jgi:hypothetical protein
MTTPISTHLDAFLSRVDPPRGRLIFALDATASRERTWDTAAHLQSQMFATVAAIGGLDVQLVYYRACQGACGIYGTRSVSGRPHSNRQGA